MIIETEVYSCRKCQSEDLVKNGTNASGSSQYHCKACGAYGILKGKEHATEEKKELIINVYQERSSMRGIERTFGVSRRTLSAWLKEQANDLPPLEETLQPVECKKIPVLEEAIVFSDYWSAYRAVIPSEQQRPVGKETGETAHIERWNNTLRQHLARFVRKTFSFSKCAKMHEICLKLFIHRYNTELLPIVG